MKIVHVVHHYWPVVGGIENVVRALAEGMTKLGHEVHVVTSTFNAEGRPREEVINEVYVHRVRSLRLSYPDLTYPLDYPVGVLKNADIIHGHSQNSLFTVKIIERAKRLGVKTVMHFMAVDALDDHPNPLVRLTATCYGRWILLKAIRSSDVKLVKSYKDGEILRSRYNIDAAYMPDGVAEELLKTLNMADEFRAKYRVQGPFVVYVGRLHRLKGVDVLIKAMSIVTREEAELRAVIIGPGDQRPYKRLAHRLGVDKNIVFTGFVDDKTRIGALDASTALVLPSISNYAEVFSLAITEAWARGKPVIASAVGEIPYRIKHRVNGLLVPPRDSKELANAILLLANNKELGSKLGANGRKSVLTWNEIITKLIEIYKVLARW
jgi:glycosyltransferase involved in cell wall biosynthesis